MTTYKYNSYHFISRTGSSNDGTIYTVPAGQDPEVYLADLNPLNILPERVLRAELRSRIGGWETETYIEFSCLNGTRLERAWAAQQRGKYGLNWENES